MGECCSTSFRFTVFGLVGTVVNDFHLLFWETRGQLWLGTQRVIVSIKGSAFDFQSKKLTI